MSLDPAPLIEPPEPPLDGGDPALLVGRVPELFHQFGGRVDVGGGHGVLQRLLGQAVAQAPLSRPAPQNQGPPGFQPLQLGQQHVP